MSNKLDDLATRWIAAKEDERAATELRRIIEDEIARLMEVPPEEEVYRKVDTKRYEFKITSRLNRKINGDLAQEIAAEHDLQDHLSLLFRWKPELNVSVWKGVEDRVRSIFSPAITSTPGRPSFAITEKEKN
jgi:hypothetical protein